MTERQQEIPKNEFTKKVQEMEAKLRESGLEFYLVAVDEKEVVTIMAAPMIPVAEGIIGDMMTHPEFAMSVLIAESELSKSGLSDSQPEAECGFTCCDEGMPDEG